MNYYYNAIQVALDSLNIVIKPQFGLIIGSGLGAILEGTKIMQRISYKDIEGFPRSTAPTHHGELLVVLFNATPVLVFNGRLHLYEGLSAHDVAMPVYLSKLLGIEQLFLTNAAGSLNPDFNVGDVMLMTDHINFTGHNPVVGLNDEWFGSRFPDMSQPYSLALRKKLLVCASELGIELREGVYAGVMGPSLETSAERRMMRLSGCDAVGMSTVLEVIAANHCGIEVAALSAVTNSATGGEDQQPDSIEAVLIAAQNAAHIMRPLLHSCVADLVV